MNEANTFPIEPFCKFDRLVTMRFHTGDILPKELWKPINLEKIKNENEILKMNIKFGSAGPCKCQKCNPDTSI